MMKGWQPIDYMVGLLVIAMVVMLLMTVVHMLFGSDPADDASAKRVNVIINSVVAIISMYIGAQIQKNRG
jgi:hypothetical protein